MFRATIAGTKTQTRRLIGLDHINKNPGKAELKEWEKNPEIARSDSDKIRIGKGWHAIFHIKDNEYEYQYARPRYQPGEILYLKEPYSLDNSGNVIYYFDCDQQARILAKWENKLFMPAKYARYFIEIISVRPERLQNISEFDAHLEGVKYSESKLGNCYYDYRYGGYNIMTRAKDSFCYLWQTINGKQSWQKNPWVWVYSYELYKS